MKKIKFVGCFRTDNGMTQKIVGCNSFNEAYILLQADVILSGLNLKSLYSITDEGGNVRFVRDEIIFFK